MNSMLHVICPLLFTPSAVQALTYSSAEGVFARQLAVIASGYATEHNGQAPESWSDLEAHLGQSIDNVYRHIMPTRRYSFLSQPLSLPPPHSGELLVITRRPFRDTRLSQGFFDLSGGLREPGRYIICRTRTNDFRSYYVDEAYVQQIFRGFESLLPTPDKEPLRSHEIEARLRSIIVWIFVAVIATLILARRLLRRSSALQNTGNSA